MSCLSSSSKTPSSPSSSDQSSSNDVKQELSAGYLKDHFNVAFFDCKCCCDASKEMSKCQTGSIEFLRDMQEYLNLPEYRLNCRCSCDDTNTPIKFGINLTPSNDFK